MTAGCVMYIFFCLCQMIMPEVELLKVAVEEVKHK